MAPLFQEYANGSISQARELSIGECAGWISDRCSSGDGVFFLAKSESAIVGFATLYPGFNSISLRQHWILNDLFVLTAYRKLGIGLRLVMHAQQHAKRGNAEYVALETAKNNTGAQALYEKLGFEEDLHYKRYYWLPDM